jgi:hypothetical protein
LLKTILGLLALCYPVGMRAVEPITRATFPLAIMLQQDGKEQVLFVLDLDREVMNLPYLHGSLS